jgi:hypothetical protein
LREPVELETSWSERMMEVMGRAEAGMPPHRGERGNPAPLVMERWRFALTVASVCIGVLVGVGLVVVLLLTR